MEETKKEYWDNGKIESEINYKNGRRHKRICIDKKVLGYK